jgi:hypothetical protein
VLIDGVPSGFAGFNFEWQDTNGVAFDGPGAATTVLLAAGDYRVKATSTASNCSSVVTPFTVDDVSVDPVITSSSLVDNTNCAGATPNGTISILVVAVAPTAATFTID